MNSRTVAALGVLATAVLAACLVIPVSRLLGTVEGMAWAALVMLLPTMAVLVATSYRYYGLLRSIAVAAVVMVITCVVTLAVAAFGFVTAMSMSVAGVLLGILIFGGPALSVVILGSLALRVARPEQNPDRERERFGGEIPNHTNGG